MSDFEFIDISGQTLTKDPGSINGQVPLLNRSGSEV